ncbi:hypothetical protein BHE74_00003246 [Ensete ventricosum]|nr:hypothetical protein GW17_00007284 [Ensete ventricosum]RWW87894.1 hypothetical protein BHE74_00003246 [Ensete ventricosum]
MRLSRASHMTADTDITSITSEFCSSQCIRSFKHTPSRMATDLRHRKPNKDYGTKTIGGREVGKKASSAKRIGGVGNEPSIYALYMEGMAALWEQPELVISLKLTEAHSTIEWVLEVYDGFVEKDWESVDEGLVHPRIMEMEQLLQLSLQCCNIVQVFSLTVGRPEKVSHKEAEEPSDEEDDC